MGYCRADDRRRASVIRTARGRRGILPPGLHGTSTRRIARGAEVSQAYLFRFFRSKTAIFPAATEQCVDRISDTFRTAARGLVGADAGRAMWRAWEMTVEDRELPMMLFQICAAAGGDPEVARRLPPRPVCRYIGHPGPALAWAGAAASATRPVRTRTAEHITATRERRRERRIRRKGQALREREDLTVSPAGPHRDGGNLQAPGNRHRPVRTTRGVRPEEGAHPDSGRPTSDPMLVRCGAVRCGAVRCGAVRCGGAGAAGVPSPI
ncbi:TetR/AcrR family transcriptional regulator [Streptomyces sp. IBSBF 2435]|uniref:TetR/AcrR family transcriptional regulator n=1 Tax=Streptomyces sp. IBSBF 2435 TaxID=2903531 RepID=UPI003FA7C159